MIKLVSLACGHSGCMKCLHSINPFANKATTTTAPCPVCRKNFHRDRLLPNVNLDVLTKNLGMHVPTLVANGKVRRSMQASMAKAVLKLWWIAQTLDATTLQSMRKYKGTAITARRQLLLWLSERCKKRSPTPAPKKDRFLLFPNRLPASMWH